MLSGFLSFQRKNKKKQSLNRKAFFLVIPVLGLLWFGGQMNTSSASELSRVQRTKQFFDRLNLKTLDTVNQFYSKDVEFVDPIGKVEGVNKLKKYYKSMYDGVQSIRWEYLDSFESGDRLFLEWRMHLNAKNLSSKEVIVEGSSKIIFDSEGKAKFHRDFFDLGALLYEHIPVLSFIIKRIKKQFHP